MQGSHLGAALAVMTSAGALLGGAGLAEAAPLPFALDTDLITSKNLTFPQFNPSLGTLNAVDITLSSSATAGTATAGLTGGEGSVTASLSGLLKVTGPGAVTAFSRPTSVSATCVVLPGESPRNCSTGPNNQDNPAFSPNPDHIASNLSAFIGLSTFDLTAAITSLVNGDIYTKAGSLAPGAPSYDQNLTWSGGLSVTFDYTAAIDSIPEPASLTLLGIGFAGLGFARRRRKR